MQNRSRSRSPRLVPQEPVSKQPVAKQPVTAKPASSRRAPITLPVAPMTAHALAVFGDRAKALDWLSTPTSIFHGKSPEEYARGGGEAEVEKILTRIEYGVFS